MLPLLAKESRGRESLPIPLSVSSCMMTKSFPAPTGEMAGETQAPLDGWGCLVPLSNLPPIPFTGPTLAPLCTTHVLPACLPCFPPPHCLTTFQDAVSDLFCPENLTPLRTGCWGALNESGSPSGLETQDMQLVHQEWSLSLGLLEEESVVYVCVLANYY